MADESNILDQLRADIADWERRQIEPRKKGDFFKKDWVTDLQRAFGSLRELAYADGWSRDDLIRLVDHAIAEAEAKAERMEAAEDGDAQGDATR